jgi:Flp pilus assembly protein TadG
MRVWVRPPVRSRDDRGSVAIEMGLLAVVFFVFVGFSVFIGRYNSAKAEVETAARSAARDISLARNTRQAVEDARTWAEVALDVPNPMCERLLFPAPRITDEQVTVTITCVVDLSEATFAPVPGTSNVVGEATEVFDQYREREAS